jgi:5-methylcytosine-specific restriction endonuclease McrA
MRTLLLNISYEPIRLVSWQTAVSEWFLGKVEILASYDELLHSCYLEIPTPAVVRLIRRHHQYRQENVPLERRYVYARDSWKCCYCGERFPDEHLTYDHVVPQSRGGRMTWTNIVTACTQCNNRKDDRTPDEAGMPLLSRPRQPRWMPSALVDAACKREIPPQWQDWVGWMQVAA